MSICFYYLLETINLCQKRLISLIPNYMDINETAPSSAERIYAHPPSKLKRNILKSTNALYYRAYRM